MISPKANSDIGVNETDDAYLSMQYPAIAEFLKWQSLRDEFQEDEEKAKSLKRQSGKRSIIAIIIIIASLFLTQLAERTSFSVPVLSAVALALLILALLLGKGVLYGRARDEWLKRRLAAERIRQVYFQFLLAHVEQVCGSGALTPEFEAEREQFLAWALYRVRDDDYLDAVLNDEGLQEADLVGIKDPTMEAPDLVGLSAERYAEFQDFWVEWRFEWQAKYAKSQLGRKATSFAPFGSMADKEETVSILEFTATMGIVAFSVVAVVIQLITATSLAGHFVLLTSLFAIVVAGLQAYRDGVGLSDDLLRNRMYASYTTKLLQNFCSAREAGDRKAEYRAMKEMEDLAYFETRLFVIAHRKAKFSL